MSGTRNDDPRKLRALINKVSDLARSHSVRSVLVGLAAPEGDLLFPEFVDFLQSALRVEDGIFRMTRERAVLHLADVDPAASREVIDRLLADFIEQYPSSESPNFQVGCVDVTPGGQDLSVKTVLMSVFDGESTTLH